MTLALLKDSLDKFSEWIKRIAKRRHYSLEYLKGLIEGAYQISLTMLRQADYYTDYPKMVQDIKANLLGYVMIFGNQYFIYIDDYGQSFYTEVGGKEHSFGTYNIDIISELITIVLADYIQNLSKEIEEIYNNEKM